MEFTVNGVVHEIETVTYHNQCKQYYEAKERNDVIAMHYLHLPPTYKSLSMIKSEIRLIMLKASFDAEQERIENMSPELLSIEMNLIHGIKPKPEKKPKRFWFIPLFFNFS